MPTLFRLVKRSQRSLAAASAIVTCAVSACSIGCSAGDRDETNGLAASPSHPAGVPTPRSDAHAAMRRAQIRERIARGDAVRVVLLGDSITEGWLRDGREVFERELAPLGTANLGIDGDRTQHVLGRLHEGDLDGLDPEVIVLMIGTNNLGADPTWQIVEGIGAIVQWLHAARPKAKLVLLAIFPRGRDADGFERRVTSETNEALARAARGWPVEWLDIGFVFLEPDGSLSPRVSPDGLHLGREGYVRWLEAMAPVLSRDHAPAPQGQLETDSGAFDPAD